MGNTLQTVPQGACKTSAETATFEQNDVFFADWVAAKANMGEGTVEFCCSGVNDVDGMCEGYMFDDSDAFECSPTQLSVIGDARGRIYACCPSGKGVCVVGFKESK